MPWTFELAAHRHGLYSREAFLELAACTGLRFPHSSGLSREGAGESEEPGKAHDELHRQHRYAPNHQRVSFWDVMTRLWRRPRRPLQQRWAESRLPSSAQRGRIMSAPPFSRALFVVVGTLCCTGILVRAVLPGRAAEAL